MNLAKELKKKRDAEKRLDKSSPTPSFISGANGGSFNSEQQIINNITNIYNEIQEIINNGVSGGYYEPLTTGDIDNPELFFINGDILMVEV